MSWGSPSSQNFEIACRPIGERCLCLVGPLSVFGSGSEDEDEVDSTVEWDRGSLVGFWSASTAGMKEMRRNKD